MDRCAARSVGSAASWSMTACRISQSVAKGCSFIQSLLRKSVTTLPGPTSWTRAMGTRRRLGVPRPAMTRDVTLPEAGSKHTSRRRPRRLPSAPLTDMSRRSVAALASDPSGDSIHDSARRTTRPSAERMADAGTNWVSSPRPVPSSMLCSSWLSGRSWTASTRPRTLPRTSAFPPSRISSRRLGGAPVAPVAAASRTRIPPGRSAITRPATAMPTTQALMITMAKNVRSMPLAIMPESRFAGALAVATAKRDQRQELVQQRPRQQRGDLARVVLRLHLDQVEPDELDPAQSPDQSQSIPAARSADFGRPGPWGEARIDEIDVEGKKDRTVANAPADFGQHVIYAARQKLLGRDEMKAECPGATPVLGSVQRTADPELDCALRIDQPFFDGTLAPRAVGVPLAPIAVPGVGVRVEIDQAYRAMALGDRPQLAERNAVVAADRQWDDARIQDRAQAVEHHLVTGLDVARHHGQVAGVDHREMVEDLDLLLHVIRAQQSRCLADRRRPEATPDPVADPGIEGNAHDRRVDLGHIAHLGQSHEAGDAGEARGDHRIHRPVLRHERAPIRPPSCFLRG